MLAKITRQRAVSGQLITQFVNQRQIVKAALAQCMLELELGAKAMDAMFTLQQQESAHSSTAAQNANYMRTKTHQVSELQPTSAHNTLCSSCQHNCHLGCGLEMTSTQGDTRLQACACMGHNDRCIQCPGHCTVASHFHSRSQYARVQKTTQELVDSIFQAHQTAVAGVQQAQQSQQSVAAQIDQLKAAAAGSEGRVHTLCRQLKASDPGINLAVELGPILSSFQANVALMRTIEARKAAQAKVTALEALIRKLQ